MTAAGLAASKCPSCGSVYATALETGLMFCPECRNEWNPREVVASIAEASGVAPASIEKALHAFDADALGSYDTIVYVSHDDGGSGNVRTDRYTYHTSRPHTVDEAKDVARSHFENDIGSEVLMLAAEPPIVDVPTPAVELVDDVDVEALAEVTGVAPASIERALHAFDDVDDAQTESDAVLAAAYLATLTGTGVTLEGGQRATLLDFPDDDHARVQLADGSVVTVDFNDIVRADETPDEAIPPDIEIDDATAEMFGGAALILACLVIEAGIASIEGEGDTSTLIAPPSGWFPPDEDAIPLMEQAAAGAVSMLIQTFALPRAELQAMVAGVRESVTNDVE